VQYHLLESRIAIVPVRPPAAGTKIHFHVAGPGQPITDLDHRASEIRPSFDAAKTRMKDPHRLGVQGLEFVPQQPLMLPDALEQKFRRRFLVLVENRDGAGAHPPFGVKAGWDRWHVAVAFAVSRLQSQALAIPGE
jgi:hypothetical protein